MREQLEALVNELVERASYYDDARREFERRFIEQALRKADGSVSGAAAVMGMHRNTLTRKIARNYEASRSDRRGAAVHPRGAAACRPLALSPLDCQPATAHNWQSSGASANPSRVTGSTANGFRHISIQHTVEWKP